MKLMGAMIVVAGRRWAGPLFATILAFGIAQSGGSIFAATELNPPGGEVRTSAAPQRIQKPQNSVGDQIGLDLVNTVLFFDHFFMRSATAVSPDYLQRTAEPTSRFHPDYVKYKNKEIRRAELVNRLPHVVMIGDSLSKDAHISSIPSTFWRARTRRGRDWFLDTDPSPDSIYSLFERLQKVTPVVATEYSGVGALVDSGKTKANFVRQLVRTRNFSGQVDQLLQSRRFPDLVLIWIGHNNLDWAAEIAPKDRDHPEKFFAQAAKTFHENYERQLRRVIERSQTKNHKVAIVVYGLVNFEAFFKAREQTEALRAENHKLYPYLEVDYQHYLSMRPAYRKGMIKLALIYNEELRRMVADLKRTSPRNVQVRYSNAMATVDIGRAELIHPMDAWHPSVKGHSLLAEAGFGALPPSLEFLGITAEKPKHLAGSDLGDQRSSR